MCRTVCVKHILVYTISITFVLLDGDFHCRREGNAPLKSAAVGLKSDREPIGARITLDSTRKMAFDLHLAKTALAECRELHFPAISLASNRFVLLLHSPNQTRQKQERLVIIIMVIESPLLS